VILAMERVQAPRRGNQGPDELEPTMTMHDPGIYTPGISRQDDGTVPSDLDDSQHEGAKDRAQQAAGTAADEAKHVAGTAQGEAKQVAQEAKSQVHGLLDQAAGQVDDQARTQRDRVVGMLSSLGDDLEKMGSQTERGLAADLATEAADRVHGLSSHLDGREPRDLLDDVRSFARRRPGTFLLGALAAGVVAGRLTRGAKDAQDGPSHSSGSAGSPGTAVAPVPVTTEPTLQTTPAYGGSVATPAQTFDSPDLGVRGAGS
jgi:hypothetical protein